MRFQDAESFLKIFSNASPSLLANLQLSFINVKNFVKKINIFIFKVIISLSKIKKLVRFLLFGYLIFM